MKYFIALVFLCVGFCAYHSPNMGPFESFTAVVFAGFLALIVK